MAGKKGSTSVAKRNEDDFTIVANRPDYIPEGSGRGNENVTTDDLVIPRLEIVQAISPAVIKNDPKFIKGAAAGMLNNSVTRQLYGESVTVIPVFFNVQWLVWRDRKLAKEKKISAEGGFFGSYKTEIEAQRVAEENGGAAKAVIVQDTPTHLVLLLNSETGEADEIMIPMPRTKAKISRQWNSLIKLSGGDRFSRAYTVSTAGEKNKDGESFLNFHVETLGYPPKKLLDKAEALYKSVTGGKMRTMDVSDIDGAGDAGDQDPEM